VSGPVKGDRPLARSGGRSSLRQGEPFLAQAAAAVVAFVRSLPDHPWLDRLVRGRAWIPLLGVLLAGIVATQVEVLKLGASTGRWVLRTAALTSRNEALQASVAALSDAQRIERLAARMGMVMPEPTNVTFLPLHPRGGTEAAIRGIQAPDPAQFLAALSASQAAAQAEVAPTLAATPVSPATPTTQSSPSAAPATTGTPSAPPSTSPAGGSTAVTATQPAAPTSQSTGGATSSSGGVSQTGG
jgi:cell division protein FtsL